jgi:hypothetical protein
VAYSAHKQGILNQVFVHNSMAMFKKLWACGTLYGHVVNFMGIWYMLWSFDIHVLCSFGLCYGHLIYMCYAHLV